MSADSLRTVLIFAHECAPYNAPASTIGAQRVAQFAKYLPNFGWRAVVICCDARERGAGFSSDAALRIERLIRDGKSDESLIIPTPSLPWDGLLDRWWRASNGGSRSRPYRYLWRKPLTALKQLTYGDYSSAWQPCARRAAEIVLRSIRVDACIGEHTPDAGVLLARWFARRTGVPWVADFRDPVLRPFPQSLRLLYLPRIRSLLSTAAHVVNVNDHLADLDREMFRRPTTSIPNGFDPDEFAPGRSAERASAFTIAYCGNLNPDIQAIGPFLEALRLVSASLNGDLADVRFVYRGNSAAYVSELARKIGVSSLVDAEAYVPREQALHIIQSADALLLLSIAGRARKEKYFRRGLYPAKTFEYFGARRPILCVPGDGGMLDALIRETNTGVSLGDPSSIAEHILTAHRLWKAGQPAAYEPNEELVRQFTRKSLTRRLAGVLDVLAPAQSAAAPNPS